MEIIIIIIIIIVIIIIIIIIIIRCLKNAFYNTWKSQCFLQQVIYLTIDTVKKKSF